MSKKSTPEVVDGLANRREQRDCMRRRNARGLLGRMVAGLLEQDIVLGLLAAVGDRSPGGRQFGLSAIDEPRAGRVHALKTGEIEDHAFRVFSRGKERSPGRLQLVTGADDPFPGQRQHHPVLAVLTSYGRRRGHQALRQAQTALISRRPATVERTRRRRPPGKDQGKNKPSTNRTPVHTDSNPRTRRVESCASPRRP